jgi:hypothetical protein
MTLLAHGERPGSGYVGVLASRVICSYGDIVCAVVSAYLSHIDMARQIEHELGWPTLTGVPMAFTHLITQAAVYTEMAGRSAENNALKRTVRFCWWRPNSLGLMDGELATRIYTGITRITPLEKPTTPI